MISVQLGVPSSLFQPLASSLQEDRGICLVKKRKSEDLHGAAGDGNSVKHPWPRRVLVQEAASNRSDETPNEGSHNKDRDGFSSFVRAEEIGVDATANLTCGRQKIAERPEDSVDTVWQLTANGPAPPSPARNLNVMSWFCVFALPHNVLKTI